MPDYSPFFEQIFETPSEGFQVYSDFLQENGDPEYITYRFYSELMKQISVIWEIKLFPTGSRYYSLYWTKESDWDFYCFKGQHDLEKIGFLRGKTEVSKNSVYFGKLNILCAPTNEHFNAIAKSTAKCLKARPQTKDHTKRIWRQTHAEMGINMYQPPIQQHAWNWGDNFASMYAG